MVDDARRLLHEALLLALNLVEVVVGAHVLGHAAVDVRSSSHGDDLSVFLLPKWS